MHKTVQLKLNVFCPNHHTPHHETVIILHSVLIELIHRKTDFSPSFPSIVAEEALELSSTASFSGWRSDKND